MTSEQREPATIVDLQADISAFCEERDWRQFHSPKNLAMALAGEVGELVSIFQWHTEAQSWDAAKDPQTRADISDEVADVFIYLVRLAEVMDLDVASAVREKLAANRERYAVEVAWGTARKQPHRPESS